MPWNVFASHKVTAPSRKIHIHRPWVTSVIKSSQKLACHSNCTLSALPVPLLWLLKNLTKISASRSPYSLAGPHARWKKKSTLELMTLLTWSPHHNSLNSKGILLLRVQVCIDRSFHKKICSLQLYSHKIWPFRLLSFPRKLFESLLSKSYALFSVW